MNTQRTKGNTRREARGARRWGSSVAYCLSPIPSRLVAPVACCLLLLGLPARAAVLTNSISALTAITTPSTNTYLEVADLSATPKSRKIWLLDLARSILSYADGASVSINNFFSTNNFFLSGKGNTLVITQTVQFAWTTLTMSGSNVSALNLTNGSFFKLTLTNDAFMVAPINFPGTNFGATYQVHAIQDGPGGHSLTLTNSSYVMAGSGTSTNAVAALNTNANAVTVLTFVTSPFSATKLYGVVAATGQ